MKERISIFFLVFFLSVIIPGSVFSQQLDISGTWLGTAEVPNEPDVDHMTLVLKKEGDHYSGVVSDTLGFVDNSECEEIEFKNGELTFHFDISDGYEIQTIYLSLRVEGSQMTGAWENDAGDSGEVHLKKQR